MNKAYAMLVVWIGCCAAARAADAAFAEDGKSVYAVSGEALERIDVTTGEITKVDPEGVGEISAICRAGGGAFYLLSADTLWRWNPGKGPAVAVQKPLKAGQSFDDVACEPRTGRLIIVGTGTREGSDEVHCQLFFKPGINDALTCVWLRHLQRAWIRGVEFLPDGSLLFGAEGDLWHGVAGMESTEEPGESYADFSAYRYAPVGERYTYSGTPSEAGVCAIAAGAGRVFVHVRRINGSGWGHLSSLAPPPEMTEGNFEAHNSVEDSIRALQSVKQWEGNGSCSYLCASPDGKRVYFTNGMGATRTHFLADAAIQNGDPVAFRVGEKIVPSD